jgi:hypothetical protein
VFERFAHCIPPIISREEIDERGRTHSEKLDTEKERSARGNMR